MKKYVVPLFGMLPTAWKFEILNASSGWKVKFRKNSNLPKFGSVFPICFTSIGTLMLYLSEIKLQNNNSWLFLWWQITDIGIFRKI